MNKFIKKSWDILFEEILHLKIYLPNPTNIGIFVLLS